MEKKKKGNYTYEFQEFIAINQIDLKKLPKFLRKMVKHINKLEGKAKKNCTASHYRIVAKQLRPFANEVMDELYEIFQDQIKNNKIVEVEEEISLQADEVILEMMKKEERFYVKTKELYDLGVAVSKYNRTIQVGDLELQRGLAQDKWRVISNKKEKGGDYE